MDEHKLLADLDRPNVYAPREPRTEEGHNLLVEVEAASHRGDGITVQRTREAILRIEAQATRRERERVANEVRSIPSYAMDTLVPNTGPDVVTRNDVWDAIARGDTV